MLIRISERIDAGAAMPELLQWHAMILSVPCRFKALESEESRYFEVLRARHIAKTRFRALAQTAMQWIFDVAGFSQSKHKALGRRTHEKELANIYSAHIGEVVFRSVIVQRAEGAGLGSEAR